MGYYVTLEESSFVIPAEHLEEAARLLKALNHKPGVVKNGGSYSGGKHTVKWFSWMEEDYDQKFHTAKEIFEALGFEVECNPDDGLTLDGYDNKTGQEELFINEVAHLAEPGWEMVWRGEEGEVWRHSARGIENGRILFRPDVEEALQAAYDAGAQS